MVVKKMKYEQVKDLSKVKFKGLIGMTRNNMAQDKMRKKLWKLLVLIGSLIIGIFIFLIGIFIFRIVRHNQIQERARENGQALIELVNSLEYGEIITTDDVPFEWDCFVIYEPYTAVHLNPACMERSLLFQDFLIPSTYLCFFHNDRLVARVTTRPHHPRVFQLMENNELIGSIETPCN